MSISSIHSHTPVVKSSTATTMEQAAHAQAETTAVKNANADARFSEKESVADVGDAVKLLNTFIETSSPGIQFSLDDSSGRTVVKIVDIETKTVLRQIPSAEALSIAQSLDKLQGLLIREKA
jgi:flagellar protein FlaG